jgi:hypothetical protein
MLARPFEGTDSLSHNFDFLLMCLPADFVSQVERAGLLFQLHQLLHQPFTFSVPVIHSGSWRVAWTAKKCIPEITPPTANRNRPTCGTLGVIHPDKRDADSSEQFVEQKGEVAGDEVWHFRSRMTRGKDTYGLLGQVDRSARR